MAKHIFGNITNKMAKHGKSASSVFAPVSEKRRIQLLSRTLSSKMHAAREETRRCLLNGIGFKLRFIITTNIRAALPRAPWSRPVASIAFVLLMSFCSKNILFFFWPT
jgi:hypothetical protein